MYNQNPSNQLPSVERRQQDFTSKIPRISGANQNHAYIGVLGDNTGGALGINRAEKELIMRRYKAGPHGQVSSLSRIYNEMYIPQYSSQDRSSSTNLVNGYKNQINKSYQNANQNGLNRNDSANRYLDAKAVNIVQSTKNQLSQVQGRSIPRIYNLNQNKMITDANIMSLQRRPQNI